MKRAPHNLRMQRSLAVTRAADAQVPLYGHDRFWAVHVAPEHGIPSSEFATPMSWLSLTRLSTRSHHDLAGV